MMSQSDSGNQKGRSKSTNCHQCRRNDRGRVVHCSKCRRKQYCVRCIINRYPEMVEASFVEACPACLGICDCGSCLKSKVDVVVTTAAVPETQYVEGDIICDVIHIEEVCKIEASLKQRAEEFVHSLPPHHSSSGVATDFTSSGSSCFNGRMSDSSPYKEF